jgi:hypothetical protein
MGAAIAEITFRICAQLPNCTYIQEGYAANLYSQFCQAQLISEQETCHVQKLK